MSITCNDLHKKNYIIHNIYYLHYAKEIYPVYIKTYYNEIWFCDRYYIGGTNILSDGNRKFIKEININLYDYSKNFPYKYIKGANIYSLSVNRKKFKVAIAEIAKNIYIIAYLNFVSFAKSVKADDDISRQKNSELLFNFAVKHARETSAYVDVEYVYNQNNAVRYRIKSENGCVLAQKQVYCLNPDATIAILNNLENNPY